MDPFQPYLFFVGYLPVGPPPGSASVPINIRALNLADLQAGTDTESGAETLCLNSHSHHSKAHEVVWPSFYLKPVQIHRRFLGVVGPTSLRGACGGLDDPAARLRPTLDG